MIDEQKLAKDVVNGEFELLCPEMQLLSCPNYDTSLFDGTGLIRSRSGGRLLFEIVGRYDQEFPPLSKLSSPIHGQIPEPGNHVMLRAVDAFGREWRSNWVMPKTFPSGNRSNIWSVSCPLESLMNFETRPSSSMSEERLYIKMPPVLPVDQATHTTRKVGEEIHQHGWSLDHHVCTINSAQVEFRQYESHWLTVRTLQSTPVMPDWAGLMCQALSFAIAQTVRPVVAVREFNTRKDIGIFSGSFSYNRSYLTRPVPPSETKDFWVLIQKFIEWVTSVDFSVVEDLFDELQGIRNGSMGSIQTAALTLATAVESIAFLLLDSIEVERDCSDKVDLLLKHVREWDGDCNVRHRAISILGSLKKIRTVDRLHQFAQISDTSTELVDAWKKLRDMVAHGRASNSNQQFIDRYFSSAELLYRILAFVIGYQGSLCATAKRGWGLDEWGFPENERRGSDLAS